MNDEMKSQEWDPKETNYTKDIISQRILSTTSHKGWQHTIKLIHELTIPFEQLNVAEIGCGSGTFSLTLGLLGAKVTLIDYNEKALDNAKKIYNIYGCKARYLKANCLDQPPGELQESFDIVVSGGLAEHFVGKNREKCISYHMMLLRKDGFAYVGVPNQLSPFYWMVRGFRELTNTWGISLEVPFSNAELKKIAKTLAFQSYYVLGNASLRTDCRIYTRGLISAIVDILPPSLREKLRRWKRHSTKTNNDSSIVDARKHMGRLVNDIKERAATRTPMADQFSAGIILFAFR